MSPQKFPLYGSPLSLESNKQFDDLFLILHISPMIDGLRGKFIVTVSGCPCSTGTSISVTDPTPAHTLILVP